MAKSLRDLQKATGRSRETCIRAIESGQCPGYRIGESNSYSIPDEAFDLFVRGYWEPVTARVTKLQPTAPLIHRRNTTTAITDPMLEQVKRTAQEHLNQLLSDQA